MDDHPTDGSVFMVRDTAFRCIATVPPTALFECNTCTAVVTDPDRHLRHNH
jgi:hypothetical protein